MDAKTGKQAAYAELMDRYRESREFIYGVCDKTGKCDSYFGFFKNEKDAEHEVGVQANRLKEDLGMMEIDIQTDRALFNGKIVIVIHRYVLR